MPNWAYIYHTPRLWEYTSLFGHTVIDLPSLTVLTACHITKICQHPQHQATNMLILHCEKPFLLSVRSSLCTVLFYLTTFPQISVPVPVLFSTRPYATEMRWSCHIRLSLRHPSFEFCDDQRFNSRSVWEFSSSNIWRTCVEHQRDITVGNNSVLPTLAYQGDLYTRELLLWVHNIFNRLVTPTHYV